MANQTAHAYAFTALKAYICAGMFYGECGGRIRRQMACDGAEKINGEFGRTFGRDERYGSFGFGFGSGSSYGLQFGNKAFMQILSWQADKKIKYINSEAGKWLLQNFVMSAVYIQTATMS